MKSTTQQPFNEPKTAIEPNTCYEKFGVYPFQEMVINSKNKEGFEKLLQSKGLQFTTTPGGWYFEKNSITYHYRCDISIHNEIIWACIEHGY